MKTKFDPRHQKRIRLMKALFTFDFNKKEKAGLSSILEHLPVIDKKIKNAAPERPLKQINKIDLAILRLSVFELIIEKETPLKVIVDEAVELGKEFGSESSPAFINGSLGKLIQTERIETNGE